MIEREIGVSSPVYDPLRNALAEMFKAAGVSQAKIREIIIGYRPDDFGYKATMVEFGETAVIAGHGFHAEIRPNDGSDEPRRVIGALEIYTAYLDPGTEQAYLEAQFLKGGVQAVWMHGEPPKGCMPMRYIPFSYGDNL